MNTLEIQNIKSHFSNVLNHYNNLKKRFVDASNELESLNIQLIELKNKINSLNMESSIIYFFEIKELLSNVEKNIFDLDVDIEIPEPPVDPPVEPEIIVPTIGSIELNITNKKASVSTKAISDSQNRINQVTYYLKTSVRNTIEQKTTTNPNEIITFTTVLTPGDYIVEAIFSYRGAQSLEQIIKSSNLVTVKEDVIIPPPTGDKIATLKLTSSQSWSNGFSAAIELISHSTENFGGNWEINFDSPATGLSQWQINASKTGSRFSITSGTDWSGAPHFNLGPNGNFKIDGINGTGAPFDINVASNATLNGQPITLIINGETVEGGTTPPVEPPIDPPVDPEIPTVNFPEKLPLIGATDVEAIYLNGDNTQLLGTVSIPSLNIHTEYAVYVNGFKTTTKPVEFTRRSSMVSVSLAVASLPLLTGNNTVQLVFAGTNNSIVTYYQTNILTIKKESSGNSKKTLVGYWSSWGGNIQTSYVDLEDTPAEYDTIVVSFIESPDHLTPVFNPAASNEVTKAQFKEKVARMKAKGHNVIIAIGGQNGVFHIKSESDKQIFKNGVINIIEEYGFNGFDIDLEGQSAQNGTTYVVDAIKEIIEYFRAKDPNFIYSMAPEVAYLINTGFGTLYIDLIKKTKHLITTIHPQYYNAPGTGVYPFDGSGVVIDCKNQAKFIPEFTEALIKGHDGPAWGGQYAQLFPIGPIPQEILAIGLPAGVGAAGTGAINDMNVYVEAWREVQRRGYDVKGFMTWSIDWDKYHNWQFKNAVAPLIK
ncbi:glycosyl hydrolase family 18 protein [Cetobacterium somerae]|uniref:glycosyl hydrolase family 18 protein n=1 Tax=Cetobacterium sp. NK01 TaxID=2993530 RepID=UPI002116FD67|nr:glycosyl hydrolase family 18 protein [Cetobacterium sp. NK01]MCQ8213127.1 glycosyl hydrolase family 18 protein [Cetobacterium sp. NK01]